MKNIEARFWKKVDRSGGNDACWIWTASRNSDQYGCFRVVHKRAEGAHRFAWRLAHGPIPKGLHVLHRCDNPPCVNPSHLWLGTNADNIRDCDAKGRRRRARKVGPETIAEIRAAVASGELQRVVGARYGVSQPQVSRLCSQQGATT